MKTEVFHQIFQFPDLYRVVLLAFLELLLSADNAVVLGVLTRHLPLPLRRKALFIGIISAFFLRAGALLSMGILFKYLWIQVIGALYLIYLSLRYFTRNKKSGERIPSPSFWKTVMLIELLDLVFALDSIIAGLGFIDAVLSKVWIVYLGGMIGLMGMRFAAEFFSRLLDRFPRLESSAYLLVGWIGIKLGTAAIHHPIPSSLFWTFTLLVFLLGFFKPKQ